MKTVKDWLDKQTVYEYNNAGDLIKTQLLNGNPSGPWTDYVYDTAGRLDTVTNKSPGGTTMSSFDYTLDAAGNRTAVDTPGTQDATYGYDPLYRLLSVDYQTGTDGSYTYDANGNRKTLNGTTYDYDGTDQMISVGGVSYGYDNNGNQISAGANSFTYDHENRLRSSTIGGVTATSTYNGDGLRMNHTVNGVPTNYVWDANAPLPVVLQDGTNTYVYGLDLISATDGAGSQTYFMYDGLGSTVNLTDGAGAPTAAYTYDVFGATLTGPATNAWQFTGEQRDADSSLYYLRARYYDPATGRFLGRDPIMAAEPYAYVGNNPVNWVDPYGLCIPDYVGRGGCGVATGTPADKEGGFRTPSPKPTPTLTPTPTPRPTIRPEPCEDMFGAGIEAPGILCWDDAAAEAASEWLAENTKCAQHIAEEFGETFIIEYGEERGYKLPGWLKWVEIGSSLTTGTEACLPQ